MNSREATELRSAVLRLAVQFTVLIVVLLALMGAVLYSIVAASSAEATNKSLTNATQVDSPHDVAAGVYVAISDDGQLSTPPALPKGLPDMAAIDRVAASHTDEQVDFSTNGHTYRVLTVFRGDRVIQAAIDTREGHESLSRLVWAMIIAIGASAVLAAAASVWMARRAMRPLVDSLALQRRFVADASHELRTPLTLLSTRAQLLRRKVSGPGLPPAEVSTEVARIVEDSRMLTGILDDLLISADPRGAVDHTAVDLIGVANSAVTLAGPQASQQSIQLDSVGDTGPVSVQGSPVALLRVFTALISNALDHAKSSVKVEVRARGGEVRIVVADDGPGFAPGTASRAFERFSSTRAESSTAGVTRHYGLGLALVAEIVALHNGKILVEPPSPGAGAGAVVVVILPLLRERKSGSSH